MLDQEQTRREFCACACRVLSLTAAGMAAGTIVQGCGGGSPTSPSNVSALPVVNGSEANGSVVLAIDSASPLSAVGSAALLQSSAGPILVAHTAQDSFNALTAICTHAACTITGFASDTFVCPCHGSQFNTNGQVLNGPAPAPLSRFVTAFSNNVLTITL